MASPMHPLARAMRWGQLTLVEDDPGKFDPAFWISYFTKIKAEGACLSAGGVVAYYPTKVPLHHRSLWLGSSDPFGELVHGCRTAGMAILARTDPHAFHEDVFSAHPDWAACDLSGEPRRHWASPELWVACPLGPYGFEFMSAVHTEIARLYPVDGIFINRWAGSGPCGCPHCREGFLADTGRDLPRGSDHRAPEWRAYFTWKERKLLALWDRWQEVVSAARPGCAVVPNTGPGEVALAEIVKRAPLLVGDRQARSGATPAWMAGRYAREYRARQDGTPAAGLFSVGLEEAYRWKDSVNTPAEIRLWAAGMIAHGMRPWVCKFSGFLHDRRWLPVVEEIFVRHAKVSTFLTGTESAARVAVVTSSTAGQHLLGWCHALIEARIPFDILDLDRLAPDLAERFRVIVLPNAAEMADRHCEAVRGFAGRGGRVVASYETSLYSEAGIRRADFGLAALFGVHAGATRTGPEQNAYLRIERDAAGAVHPIAAGLEDAGRIIAGVRRVEVTPTPGPLMLIPSYPDLPMEKVYPRETPREPGVVAVDSGAGRVVYLPGDLDRTFHEVQAADHGRVLANAVRWAADEPPVVEVAGAGLVDLAVWRREDLLTVHLVNLTNPTAMRGPARELFPLSGLRVSLALPARRSVKAARWLSADQSAVFEVSAGRVIAAAPAILDHEILAVELA